MGKSALENNETEMALEQFGKAFSVNPDSNKIFLFIAKANLALSEKIQSTDMALPAAERSFKGFAEAVENNSLDAEALFGIGAALDRIEYLKYGSSSACNAMEYFRKAISLSPNNVRYRLHLVGSLEWCGNYEDLAGEVEKMAEVFPNSYRSLIREGVWNDYIAKHVKAGLRNAFLNVNMSREAHFGLSHILEQEGDFSRAVDHYRAALSNKTFLNNSGNHLVLGRLLLKGRQLDAAKEEFLIALSRTDHLEPDLRRVYRYFKAEGLPRDFVTFYKRLKENQPIPVAGEILLGKSLILADMPEHAKKVYLDIIKNNQSAEAYYQLALIAKDEKNWDSMELFTQKAAFLDPGRPAYHLTFSQALMRKRKYKEAERQVTLAIPLMEKPSQWTYNQRASIRWQLNDYAGALEDWKTAIGLDEKRAAFYAQAARACERLGDKSASLDFCKNAIKYDPNNVSYKQLYDQLNQ